MDGSESITAKFWYNTCTTAVLWINKNNKSPSKSFSQLELILNASYLFPKNKREHHHHPKPFPLVLLLKLVCVGSLRAGALTWCVSSCCSASSCRGSSGSAASGTNVADQAADVNAGQSLRWHSHIQQNSQHNSHHQLRLSLFWNYYKTNDSCWRPQTRHHHGVLPILTRDKCTGLKCVSIKSCTILAKLEICDKGVQ